MKKFILFFFSLLFFGETIQAQQLPIFTQYRENLSLINPASVNADYTGFAFKPNSSMGITYRYQWAGIKDAPRTMTGRYEHVLEDMNMLFGGAVIRDKTGPTGTTGAYLRYAYQMEFSRYSFLSIGLSGGFLQYQYRGKSGLLRDPGDNVGLARNNANYTEFSVGAFFQTELENDDIFYAGLSIPQFAVLPISQTDGDFKLDKTPHFYGQVGLYKYLGDGFGSLEGAMFVEPSLWLKYAANSPVQLDGNIRLQMADLFWIGTGYSISMLDNLQGNSFHFEVGFSIGTSDEKAMKIGYGFDKSITNYGPEFGSSHEINLTYSFLR